MTGRARPYRDNAEHLRDELRRLDLLIGLRIAEAALQNEIVPETQVTRTVYITAEEVRWLLEGGDTPARQDRAAVEHLSTEIRDRVRATGIDLALPTLQRRFGLSDRERQALVVCLAPELRRKYDRLYAYLQDDITRKRPSVDLVLELVCDSEEERWQARGLFDAGPLLRARLLRPVDDPHSPSGSSGLAQQLALDPRILQFLLGADTIDADLTGHVQLHPVTGRPVAPEVDRDTVDSLLRLTRDAGKLILYLHGPVGVGRLALARHTCDRRGVPLLSFDMDAEHQAAFREATLRQAAVYIELTEAGHPLTDALRTAISGFGGWVFLAGQRPWTASDPRPLQIEVPVPDIALRTAVWRDCLAGRTSDPDSWAAQLAAQFRLVPAQIRAAAEAAEAELVMRGEDALDLTGLSRACRRQSGHRLAELAVKVEPRRDWDDIVLPADRTENLREICAQVRHRYHVLDGWGFGRKLGHGTGVSVLFSGPPGTGKTLAAEVLARELELDLYKIDLSAVVSKYIGETERNLSKIFAEAETSNAILFFDEADALFGKRTEISDAHDRYANIEISYLLQKMEEYEGVVILATNLGQNMDEAFTRRIRFIVRFPFPDADSRLRIWRNLFPAEAPVAAEVDFGRLAQEYPLAGGSIKNIVLNAAYLAADDGGEVGSRHIRQGARREFDKIGKLWPG